MAPKTALVTGGARRIGAAIARDLATHGYRVIVHCNRSVTEAEELVEGLRRDEKEAAVLSADLMNTAETGELFARARARFGPIGLLVNNASAFLPDTADKPDWKAWETHFGLHLRAPAQLAQVFAAQADLDAGLIVNVTDQRIRRLNPRFYSYTLSKSALWTATKTMALAFAPRIRVNAIAPGPTLPNERQSEKDFARQIAGLPLKRQPALEEFGRTVRWLAETPSVTGQMIAIDGGQHLAWRTPDIDGVAE
jgi:NAD(P)-dependent dehydrogenase (short-subunit alcohol dehydrogenase family)